MKFQHLLYFRKEKNNMFGLPISTFLLTFVWPILAMVGSLIYAITGNYEGKKMEEKYGEENWYNTF